MNTKQKVYLVIGLALIAFGTWDSFREYKRQWQEFHAEVHRMRLEMDKWAKENDID